MKKHTGADGRRINMVQREKPPLPDFEDPPVIEVVLGVQFDRLQEISTPQLGLLWAEFRERFPRLEEHPPLPPVFEKFDEGPPEEMRIRLELADMPSVPRCWFLNEQGTELIQVQTDRFIHNWRKRGESDAYPRYEKIKKTFRSELVNFEKFLKREGVGALVPNQWEVTYINHIFVGRLSKTPGRLDQVFSFWTRKFSDGFLVEPEDARFSARFAIRDQSEKPIGRLHANLQPGFLREDGSSILVLTLTARGAPEKPEIASVLRSLDLGREHVVRSFASITTPQAHKMWGRQDDR